MFNLPCVILCGGKSSRMGENKALLPFSNFNSLTQYQYSRLKPYFKDIYLSAKMNKFDFIDEKKIIYDENNIYSPLISINKILNIFNKVFLIPIDTPFIKISSIERIINESKDIDICIAETKKTHNLCGVFSSNIKNNIEDLLKNNNYKIKQLIDSSNHKIIRFYDDTEFMNINNKNEYEKSLEYISKYNNSYLL